MLLDQRQEIMFKILILLILLSADVWAHDLANCNLHFMRGRDVNSFEIASLSLSDTRAVKSKSLHKNTKSVSARIEEPLGSPQRRSWP